MIEKLLVSHKLSFKRLILVYDEAQMRSAGYYSRIRGFANAASSEVAFVAWTGRQPKLSVRTRVYVDVGTDVYSDVPLSSRIPNSFSCFWALIASYESRGPIFFPGFLAK